MELTIRYIRPNLTSNETRAFWNWADKGVLYPGLHEQISHSFGERMTPGEVFAEFNIGDRFGLSCRSMMMGDVVEIDGHQFICMPAGWNHVDRERTANLCEFLEEMKKAA